MDSKRERERAGKMCMRVWGVMLVNVFVGNPHFLVFTTVCKALACFQHETFQFLSQLLRSCHYARNFGEHFVVPLVKLGFLLLEFVSPNAQGNQIISFRCGA